VVTPVCVCVCVCVCVSVCLSDPRRIPTLLHGTVCNLEKWYGVPHSCALLDGFAIRAGCCCYDNVARTRNVSECLYSPDAWCGSVRQRNTCWPWTLYSSKMTEKAYTAGYDVDRVCPSCRRFDVNHELVSWSLTSLFSTNMAISETTSTTTSVNRSRNET